MKKFIVILFLIIYPFNSIAHIGHYIEYNKIEMEIFRNDELVGYNYYFFKRNGEETFISIQLKFSIKFLGATGFQVDGFSEERAGVVASTSSVAYTQLPLPEKAGRKDVVKDHMP